MNNMKSKYLEIALPAAQAASRAILKYYKADLDVHERDGEPVTLADEESEKVLSKTLTADPEIGYLSEESDRDIPKQDTFWVVDPLDGTSDFVKKSDEFVVMIGLVQKRRPIFGLIYQPVNNVYYYAHVGQGAYKKEKGSDKPIHVSNQSNTEEATAFISRSHLLDSDKKLFQELGVLDQRPLGSALKSCRIAAGAGDIYINTSDKTGKWDVCAADIIVCEAGGDFTDLLGNRIDYREPGPNKNGFLASNGKLHSQVLSSTVKILDLK